MRAWLYDQLTTYPDLVDELDEPLAPIKDRVFPRESQTSLAGVVKPFLVFGLGNTTDEQLAEDTDHRAERQFFQVWVHDEGGDYTRIDRIIPLVIRALVNKADPASNVTTIRHLENSAEFSNQTYNTLFRYIRFQAIISKGVRVA